MTIFRSPYPDVTIPEVPLPGFVLAEAGERGDKPALIDGASGRTVTYAQLALGVQLAAGGMAARGFRKGDVLAIYSPNIPEYAVAFYGAVAAGATVTTVSPLYTVDELAFQLNDANATYLLTVPPFMDKAREAASRSGVKEIFVFGEAEGATPVMELLTTGSPPPAVDVDPRNDVVALPYSSGTTGFPKGVMLTHHNFVANLCQGEPLIATDETATVLAVLPFFHSYGLGVLLGGALWKGATLITMLRFDLEELLRVLQDYQITHAFVAPPIVLALAKHPEVDAYDLSHLRTVFSGAAPLGIDLEHACAERLGCYVGQGYGMTETSPVLTANKEGEHSRSGSVGQLLPNTEARIVGVASGAELGPHEDGEVCVRGPQVMKGYLNRPEETADLLDADGWLHTGDIGHFDEDGFLYVVDRVKELIKYKAMQVAPAELEALLLTHPAIADVAVVRSPDPDAGEVPKAFVVARSPITAEEVMAYVAGRVAPYKKIRRVEFIDEIPKALSGKILRRVLIEREAKAAG